MAQDTIINPSLYLQWHYNQLQTLQDAQKYTFLNDSLSIELLTKIDSIQLELNQLYFSDTNGQYLGVEALAFYDTLHHFLATDYYLLTQQQSSCIECYEFLILHQQLYLQDLNNIQTTTSNYYLVLDSFAQQYQIEVELIDENLESEIKLIHETNVFIWNCDIIVQGMQYETNKIFTYINQQSIEEARIVLAKKDSLFSIANDLYVQLQYKDNEKGLYEEVGTCIQFYKQNVVGVYLPNILKCFDEQGQPIEAYQQQYTSTVTALTYKMNNQLSQYLTAKTDLLRSIKEKKE